MARYRDSKTGRYVSKKTWKRSRARGSKRYRLERRRPSKRPARKSTGPRKKITARKRVTPTAARPTTPPGITPISGPIKPGDILRRKIPIEFLTFEDEFFESGHEAEEEEEYA